MYGDKGNDTLTGGEGADVFIYSAGNDVITDFISGQDVIKLESGKVDGYSVRGGKDAVLKIGSNKITLKNIGNEKFTVIGTDNSVKVYGVAEGLNFNKADLTKATAVTISADYEGKTFTAANYSALVTIDAANKFESLEIIGNAKSNKIFGTDSNDTIFGGKGNDTLTGNEGADVFVYTGGNGSDVITDYIGGEDLIQLGGNYSVKYSTKNNDAVLKIGTGNITLKNAAETAITVVGANGTSSVFGKIDNGIKFNDDKTAVTLGSNFSSNFDAEDYPMLATIDASDGDAVNIVGNSKDNLIIGGWGNDTLAGGTGADVFVYSNGAGDDVITDYNTEEDTIQTDGGLILETSYGGDDVIFNLGGGSITVKDGKDKSITITDAFGNTTSKTYSPDETSDTALTEDEIFNTLHAFSQQGLESFVAACTDIDFEEMINAAGSNYEKFAIEYTKKLYDFSKELQESEIVDNSQFSVNAKTLARSYDSVTESETKTISHEELKAKIDDFQEYKNFFYAVENFKEKLPEGFQNLLEQNNRISTLVAAYIATDGKIWEDVDLRDMIIEFIDDKVGDKFDDKISSVGVPLITLVNHIAGDVGELKDNPTFTDDFERVGHIISTLIVDFAVDKIPVLGPVFSFLPESVKSAMRDEIADAFIIRSSVVLDNSHGVFFDASPSVKIIDAEKRDSYHPIQINCTGNNTSVVGGTGYDTIIGNYGNDTLIGGRSISEASIISGGGKIDSDSIIGGGGDDKIFGNDGNDVLIGDYDSLNPYIKDKEYLNNSGLDAHIYYTAESFAGNDTIYGGRGNDTLIGGLGKDILYGGSDDDSILGGAGNDSLYSCTGSDILIGGKGDDEIYLTGGHNLISYAAGDGDDVVYGYTATDGLRITSGTSETITGGNDLIVKVGEGKITLKGAKNLKNIKFDNSKQYNGHFYAIFNVNKTWSEAKTYCEKLGGHLVTITNADEQTAVENLLKSNGSKNSYWIGGFKNINNQWKWITNENFSYSNWAYGQPDNYKGLENSAMIYYNNNPRAASGLGKWNDLREDGECNGESFFGKKNFGFICEWETENPFVGINSAIISGYSSKFADTLWFTGDDTNFVSGDNIDSLSDMITSESSVTNLFTDTFASTDILNFAQTDYSFAPDKDPVK